VSGNNASQERGVVEQILTSVGATIEEVGTWLQGLGRDIGDLFSRGPTTPPVTNPTPNQPQQPTGEVPTQPNTEPQPPTGEVPTLPTPEPQPPTGQVPTQPTTQPQQPTGEVPTQPNPTASEGRANFLRRQRELQSKFDPLADRLGKLVPPVSAVAAPLQTAAAARTAADEAGKVTPEDWPAATLLLNTFETAVADLETAAVAAAQIQSTAFGPRFDGVKDAVPAGGDFVKKYTTYLAAKKKLDGLIAGKDAAGALEAGAATELALAAFEAAAAPSDTDRQSKAEGARVTISTLTNEELANKPLLEKAGLALDICANGTPNDSTDSVPNPGGQLEQLCRLYKKSPPDPEFLKKREAQRAAIVQEVLKMPEITSLYGDDGTLDTAGWDNLVTDSNKMQALLQKVCDVQADAMGMPHLPVRKEPDPPEGRDSEGNLTFGGYNPDGNSIDLNLHEDALKPPVEALTTILHETFHAHQDVIVKKLKAGEIGPDDPDYPTALMYMVNDIGVGYVQADDVGQDNYETQPTEIDAEFQGKLAAQAILTQAQKAKTATTV
jgi:hypothetical protein